MPADVPKLCAVFHVVITSKRTENRFCMHCNSAILGIEQPAKSVGYSHTNTSFPLYIISLHRLECQRRTYSTRRRWLENKSAVSKQPTQIMNINNITRVYAKITGGDNRHSSIFYAVIRRTCLLVRRSVLGKPACSGFCNTTVLARLFRFHC